jgi:sulfofructose kinase
MNAMDPAPRVICLGLTALDATWTVEQLPSVGGKTRASSYEERGGGMAATAAVTAARLGAAAQFWGRAGHDAAGAAMRDELAAWGVDVAHLRLFDGARSSVSGVIVDARGERTIVNFRGSDQPADPGWLPLAEVRQADAVLADPRWPEGALTLFGAARRHRVPSVLDGDVAEAAVFDALLPSVDFAVFSELGLAGYAGEVSSALDVERALRFARERGCRVAAVTLGEHGVAWHDGNTLQRLPAFAVEVVDTNGAGDVFHGALAFALGARWGVREAFRFSAAVAALKCTRHGGRAGVPDLASAMSFLKRFKE